MSVIGDDRCNGQGESRVLWGKLLSGLPRLWALLASSGPQSGPLAMCGPADQLRPYLFNPLGKESTPFRLKDSSFERPVILSLDS